MVGFVAALFMLRDSNNLNAFPLPNKFGNTVTGLGTGAGAGAPGFDISCAFTGKLELKNVRPKIDKTVPKPKR